MITIKSDKKVAKWQKNDQKQKVEIISMGYRESMYQILPVFRYFARKHFLPILTFFIQNF